MEPEIKKQSIRYYELDLLRFLAALSVVLFHYTYLGHAVDNQSPIAFPLIGEFTRYGYTGVELFFIISGYVVLLSAKGKTVKQFFISRVSRLYPALWVACTLTFLIERIWGTHSADTNMPSVLHAGFGQYFYNMLLMHEFVGIMPVDGVYWSLTVEITFYFIIAVLIGWRLLEHIDWFLAGWLAYCAMPGLLHTKTPFAFLFFPLNAPYFIAGMLFYLLQQPNGRTWQRCTLLGISYLLSVKEAMLNAQNNTRILNDVTSWQIVAVIISCFFIVFYLVSFRKINFTGQAWLLKLGSLTYPLYLLHSNIGYIIFHRLNHLLNKYVLLGGALLMMLVSAYLIHVYVEKKVGKWLSAFIQNRLLGPIR